MMMMMMRERVVLAVIEGVMMILEVGTVVVGWRMILYYLPLLKVSVLYAKIPTIYL